MKYFTNHVEYPRDILVSDFLPLGTMWTYVSDSLLLGLINYTKIIKAYAVGHYYAWDEIDDDPSPIFVRADNSWSKIYPKTRHERFNLLTSNLSHIKINDFQQDVIILAQADKHDTSVINPTYVLFEFDLDCSNCVIGRFSTDDSLDTVVAEFDIYVERNSVNNHGHREIPTKTLTSGNIG